MFKLAHLSDLHLGYSSGRLVNSQGVNLRVADGYLAFNKIVSQVIAEKVDAVLVAGDTFHSSRVDNRTLAFTQNQFRRLAQARIPTFILAGNHDVEDLKSDIASSRLLHDPARKIESFIAPYEMRKISDNIVLHMVSHHAYSEQADTLLKVKPIDGMINIFSSHGSVINADTQEKLHTEASPREIIIPTALIEDGFDAALLGHIHERKYVNVSNELNKKVFYNGSVIRRGYSDKVSELERGWTLWKIDESTGTFTPEFRVIEQRPQYDFELIEAKDLSSVEISDIIINNLKATQINGKKFDSATAPILRQTIKDITLAKYSALDWKNIEDNYKHSLNGLPIKKIMQSEYRSTKKEDGTASLATNGDIVKTYDSWVKESQVLDKVDETMKEKVVKQARSFMELGREITIDE